jgi:hypothetical protein
MKPPAGFVIPVRTPTVKLEKYLCGQKRARRVWYPHPKKSLLKLGFKASNIDECVFYYGKTIFIHWLSGWDLRITSSGSIMVLWLSIHKNVHEITMCYFCLFSPCVLETEC